MGVGTHMTYGQVHSLKKTSSRKPWTTTKYLVWVSKWRMVKVQFKINLSAKKKKKVWMVLAKWKITTVLYHVVVFYLSNPKTWQSVNHNLFLKSTGHFKSQSLIWSFYFHLNCLFKHKTCFEKVVPSIIASMILFSVLLNKHCFQMAVRNTIVLNFHLYHIPLILVMVCQI